MAVLMRNPRTGAIRGRWAFIVETVIGLTLITVINMLLFRKDIGFLSMNPHPYWAVVVLISIRYGFVAGFFSGGLAGALYFVFTAATIPDISLLELRSIELWGTPLLFWVAGMVLGEIRQGHLRDFLALEDRLKESQTVCQEQKRELQALEQAKQEMDTRIFSQEHTLSTIYEAAQALRSLDADSIYPAILDLLRQYLSVEECSIYMVEDSTFVLKASKRTVSPNPRRVLSLDSDPLAAVYRSKEPATLDRALRAGDDNHGILIAAPVLVANGTEAVGVLTVDKMPFLKFNPTSIRMVALIADWCGASLENAILHKSTRERLITDDAADAYNYRYFSRRLEEEFQRARRYGLELSLIYLEIPGFTDRLPEEQDVTRIAFSAVIKSHIRNIDLLFLHETPGAFIIMLPNTPLAGARVVINNIAKAYQALVIMSFELDEDLLALKVGAGSMTSETQSSSELVDVMWKDVHNAVSAV